MIRENKWQHFTPAEVAIIAQVARYHRKSPPELKHEEFAAFPELNRQVVEKLSAILRLADSLDRNHEQMVKEITTEVLPDRIIIHMKAEGPVVREVMAAHKKADLALSVFKRKLVFMVGDQVIDPNAPPWRW